MHENLSFEQDTRCPDDRSFLILERDPGYKKRIAHNMQARGFTVTCVESACEAISLIRLSPPALAIVDLLPGRPCGLEVLAELANRRPTARAIVITAFDNFTTAVMAIKLGAIDYLPKPVEVDELCSALLSSTPRIAPETSEFMSPRRVKWEHIHRVYELCDRNVSETARRLEIHRRTLQRMLSKRAPR